MPRADFIVEHRNLMFISKVKPFHKLIVRTVLWQFALRFAREPREKKTFLLAVIMEESQSQKHINLTMERIGFLACRCYGFVSES
jgi:hypothetical protein